MATELRGVPVIATNGPLDRRLHDIGWGLLLMLTGMIWLVPAERVRVLAICLLVIGASLVARPLLTKTA